MTRPLTALLVATLLAPLAAAQEKPPARPEQAAERAEDIEVLRRILNRAVGLPDKAPLTFGAFVDPLSGQRYTGGTTGFNPHAQPYNVYQPLNVNSNPLAFTNMSAQPQVGPFDGVYLPGHGVVYTLKVPQGVNVYLDPVHKSAGLAETCKHCHQGAANLATEPRVGSKPVSEWDQTLGQLRGDKPAEAPKPTAAVAQVCEPGRLTERVVEKLWKNVKNVRHLPAGEHVTVVVTFDGYAGASKPAVYSLGMSGEWSSPRDPNTSPRTPRERFGFTPDESKQLTLGDLHLKQGKPKDAAAAYERALERFRGPTLRASAPTDLTPSQAATAVAELQTSVRGVYRQLAQAWLAVGDADKAQAALDLARKFTVEVGRDEGKGQSVPVPAKLVVSVTRTDALKAEDDLTAFRKAVTVETVGFPPVPDARPK